MQLVEMKLKELPLRLVSQQMIIDITKMKKGILKFLCNTFLDVFPPN